MAVCAALDDSEVGALERIMISRSLHANETVVEEGEERRFVYTLTSGMLRLSSMLADGRRQVTGFLLPGDYLGLADEDTYSRTAEAVAGSQLCAFPVRDMDRLIDDYPRLGERLHAMTRVALRAAQDSQMVLGRLAPVERLASFLLVLSDRAAEHKQPANPVLLPMPRADIADYLGLTVETVSRSFTKLKTEGLIALPQPHVAEIRDRAKLAALAGLPA
jgi:CRP/FNR family transcriptional regulator